MKKKFKLLLFIAVVAITGLSLMLPVFAVGSATYSFSGSSNVEVGKEFTLTLQITNISSDTNGGIVSLGGNVDFNSEYLEYVSSTPASTPYPMQINTDNNYKFAGLDTFLTNGFTTNTNIITFKFKAKKAGSTTVTVKNGMMSDKSAKLSINVAPKTITIGNAVSKSNNANLSSLSISGQNISPAFNKNTTNYTLTVPNSVSSINVNATAEDSKATVSGTGNKSLSVGENTINVLVTAEDNTTKKTYTIKVTREKGTSTEEKSNDNSLKGLTVSGYNISPAFNKDITNYELTVPNSASEIIVNASKNNDKAKVEVSGANNLKVGDNTVTVKVTAEDGSVKNYTIKVHKEAPLDETKSDDATLKGLDVSGFTLIPGFNKDVTSYTIYVQHSVDGLKVNATPNDTKAKVEVTGNLGWHDGVNTIQIKVTAENGTTKIYTVNAIRSASGSNNTNPNGNPTGNSSDATLKELVINSAHTIDKKFDAKDNSYSVTVPYEVDKLNLSYVTNNGKAKVEVTGNENFKVGSLNTVVIKVTAENGNENYYILNVERSGEKSGTDIDRIEINGEKIDPNKTINVETDELDVDIKLSDPDAKYEVIGNKNLKDGHNTVLIKVTDKNGMEKYYELDVYKEPSSSETVLGLKPSSWGILFGILAFVILLLLLLFLLFRKKKDEDKKPVSPTPTGPVIDFKPEFNFGSRNGTDDDVVYPGGSLNQGSQVGMSEEPKKLMDAEEAIYTEDFEDEDPMFDETITKDELISAIREGMETKNSDKLKMLLKQDELNQLKKKIKREQEGKTRSDRYDE